jgi:hypothetical protein
LNCCGLSTLSLIRRRRRGQRPHLLLQECLSGFKTRPVAVEAELAVVSMRRFVIEPRTNLELFSSSAMKLVS